MPSSGGSPEEGGTPADRPELIRQITDGSLYLVSTPIGHMGDLSPRALAVLEGADVVAAEDTRHTGRMLTQFGIHRSLESYHEQNKDAATKRLMEHLGAGRSVAIVSDAGTPGLSDPGFVLVRAAVAGGVQVVSVPGPSALLAALTASGLPTDAFTFIGFLPTRKGKRRRLLDSLAGLQHTLVFYESPHRVVSTLAMMEEALGDRWAAVCRELTKKFEEIKRGRLSDLAAFYETSGVKGEFTLVVAGASFHGTLLPSETG
jgi:16S rRNA (cytidine1402-2'-O)-methyltransferase